MSMFVAIVVGFCQPVLVVLHVESTTLHVSFRYVRLPVALYNIFTGMCSVRATLSVCPPSVNATSVGTITRRNIQSKVCFF